MAEDLEDFLRRAAERRKQQTKAKPVKAADAAAEAAQRERVAAPPAAPPQRPKAVQRAEGPGQGDSRSEAKRIEGLRQRDERPQNEFEGGADRQTPQRKKLEPVAQQPRRNDNELRTRPFDSQIGSTLEERRNLAESISQADDRMDSRLRGEFEHKLGQLGYHGQNDHRLATHSPRSEDSLPLDSLAGDPQAAAEMLAAAFRDPRFIKTAFIASEIFQRKF